MGERRTTPEGKLLLKQILGRPGNERCADCKTATHPRWASYNLGVLICIRCSGIHRSLGTHISKVRSVDLDFWTQDQLTSLASIGNARANAYWEAQLPDGYIPDESKIMSYIKTKYELKRWVGGQQPGASVDGDDVPLAAVKSLQSQQHPSQRHSHRDHHHRHHHHGSSTGGPPVPPKVRQSVPTQSAADLLDLGGYAAPSKEARLTSPTSLSASASSTGLLDLGSLGPTNPGRNGSIPRSATAPPPPVSHTVKPTAVPPQPQERADLKKSILELYSKAQPTTTAPARSNQPVYQPQVSLSQPLAQPRAQSTGNLNGSLASLNLGSSAPTRTGSTPSPAPVQAPTPAPASAPAPAPSSTSMSGATGVDDDSGLEDAVFANVWN